MWPTPPPGFCLTDTLQDSNDNSISDESFYLLFFLIRSLVLLPSCFVAFLLSSRSVVVCSTFLRSIANNTFLNSHRAVSLASSTTVLVQFQCAVFGSDFVSTLEITSVCMNQIRCIPIEKMVLGLATDCREGLVVTSSASQYTARSRHAQTCVCECVQSAARAVRRKSLSRTGEARKRIHSVEKATATMQRKRPPTVLKAVRLLLYTPQVFRLGHGSSTLSHVP